jgi:hypothetical protein
MSNVTKVLSIVATGVAFAALAIASAPTGQQMTDAKYAAFGDNHSRAVHAKGTMVGARKNPLLMVLTTAGTCTATCNSRPRRRLRVKWTRFSDSASDSGSVWTADIASSGSQRGMCARKCTAGRYVKFAC